MDQELIGGERVVDTGSEDRAPGRSKLSAIPKTRRAGLLR
jgi:hypothetical protein